MGYARHSRALLVVCAGLLVASSQVAASADEPLVPGAPTNFQWVSEDADSVTFGWSAPTVGADDVTGYELEQSADDQATWTDAEDLAATAFEASVPHPAAGRLVWYRVLAVSAAGPSPATDATATETPGSTAQRFVLRTSSGLPVSDGTYRWSAGDGTWSSDQHFGADGIIDLPAVPAGMSMLLQVDDAYLPNNETVAKTWSVDFGTEAQTLVVPSPPPMEVHEVTVTMPGGVPVVGAELDADYTQGLGDVVLRDGFTYADFNSLNSARSGADGTAVLRGWSNQGVHFIPPSRYPWPEQAVEVDYQNGTLHQSKVFDLTGAHTAVELAAMPWTTTATLAPTPTSVGTVTSLAFTVHRPRSSTAAIAGVRVTLTPPAGWSARRCAQGSRLTGTTSSTGHVYLKVCSSRSGGFRVKTSAPVPTGTVTLRVRRAAPLPPAHVSAHAASYGHLTVAWTRPSYSGGVAVTAYRVTLTASGQKTRTYAFRTSALTSGLTHTFGSLPRATVWRATVAAVNQYGTGSAAAAARVRVL